MKSESEEVLVRGIWLYGIFSFLSIIIPFLVIYGLIVSDKNSISFVKHIFITFSVYIWVGLSWKHLQMLFPSFCKDLKNLTQLYPHNKIARINIKISNHFAHVFIKLYRFRYNHRRQLS